MSSRPTLSMQGVPEQLGHTEKPWSQKTKQNKICAWNTHHRNKQTNISHFGKLAIDNDQEKDTRLCAV